MGRPIISGPAELHINGEYAGEVTNVKIETAKPPVITPNGSEVGSGPDGETCVTCDFCFHWLDRYHKCTHIDSDINNGSSTDISTSWPACEHWRGSDSYHQDLITHFCDAFNWKLERKLTHVEVYVIADWYRQRGEDGAFLTLTHLAEKLNPENPPF